VETGAQESGADQRDEGREPTGTKGTSGALGAKVGRARQTGSRGSMGIKQPSGSPAGNGIFLQAPAPGERKLQELTDAEATGFAEGLCMDRFSELFKQAGTM
jgi:hypothetical protein